MVVGNSRWREETDDIDLFDRPQSTPPSPGMNPASKTKENIHQEPGSAPQFMTDPVPGEYPGPWLIEKIDRALSEINDVARWSYRQDRHRGTRDAIGIADVEAVACHLGCLLGTTKALFSIVCGRVPEEIESKITLSPALTLEEGASRIRKPRTEAKIPIPEERPSPADWKVEADRARIVWRQWVPARKTRLRQLTNKLMDEGVSYPQCEVLAYREILEET